MENELIDAANWFGPYYADCKDWDVDPCTPETNRCGHSDDSELVCNIVMRVRVPSGEITDRLSQVRVKSIPKEWIKKFGIAINS